MAKKLKILGWGEWKSRGFEVTPELADVAIAHFKNRGLDLPTNYHHNRVGDASGWISELEKGEDGVYATIEFTEEAQEKIKAKKLRYMSPEIVYNGVDPKTAKKIPFMISGLALTNSPYLNDIDEVSLSNHYKDTANEIFMCSFDLEDGLEVKDSKITVVLERETEQQINNQEEKKPMLEEKIKELLQLPPEADETAILSAIEELLALLAPPAEEEASAEPVAIDNSMVIELENKVANLEKEALELKAEKFLLSNTSKIPPAMRDEVKKQYVANPEFITKFYQNSKDVIDQDLNLDITDEAVKTITLSENQKNIAKQLRVSEEAFLNSIKNN